MIEARYISLSRTELLEFAQGDSAFYGLDLSRISSIFIAQMLQLKSNRVINIFNVTEEIKSLEGIGSRGSTKRESAFKANTPLARLYYKHFTDARFIGENLAAEFGYHSGGNKNLSNIIGRLVHEHKGQYVSEGFANAIAYETTIGAIERRAKRKKLGYVCVKCW